VRSLYSVFHLNLAFSAVPVAARDTVIARCYHPLLDTVERAGLPMGIELSGWTLEEIDRRDDRFVQRLRALLSARLVELVGSGYVQLIGPLVPAAVNRANQEEGLRVYEALLGVRPGLALVNEMAYSSGLVDIYAEAGYRGLLMERENLSRALGAPVTGAEHAVSPGGTTLPLLLADSMVFQKFQRVIHEDIPRGDLEDYLAEVTAANRPTALYASDAEVFDYRPRRYHYEREAKAHVEWDRITALLKHLATRYRFVTPSEALSETQTGRSSRFRITDAHYPIPVKKQLKYNLARWAVTGRDDLWLNTRCHRMARSLDITDVPARRLLLESWSSDLRTHIDPDRLSTAIAHLEAYEDARPGAEPAWSTIPRGITVRELSPFALAIETDTVRLVLNRRRGLTIQSLAFTAHDLVPTIGTLPHGYFQAIDLGADFYSGGVVIETPAPSLRITDLERLVMKMGTCDGRLVIEVEPDTPFGRLVKRIEVDPTEQDIAISYAFPGWQRPAGTVRVGNITLLPEAFDTSRLRLRCTNGGEREESFTIGQPCRHHAAVSTLVSCTAGFGATTGELILGDGARDIALRWDPAQCAAFPMLWHEPSAPAHLTRAIFSLAERDDTSREGGRLTPFRLSIAPFP